MISRIGASWTPFKLEFYHQGMYFDTPVQINEVTATRVKPISYSPDYFDFGSVKHDPESTKKLGFAGFKVLYPINKADKKTKSSVCSVPAIFVWLVKARFMVFLLVGWLLIPH